MPWQRPRRFNRRCKQAELLSLSDSYATGSALVNCSLIPKWNVAIKLEPVFGVENDAALFARSLVDVDSAIGVITEEQEHVNFRLVQDVSRFQVLETVEGLSV